MKNHNWVDIHDNGKKFVKLPNARQFHGESVEKINIFKNTIIGAILALNKRRSSKINESSGEENTKTWDDFKNIDQWKDFKTQALMIGSYLSSDSEQIKQTLDEMENDFKALSDSGDVNMGFQMAMRMEEVLSKSGIQSSPNTKGVLPEIKAKNLIDIVAGKRKDDRSKLDYSSITPQFMKYFIQCLLKRDERKFGKFIPSDVVSRVDGEQIKKSIGKKNLEIFNNVISANSYQKNGSACGRGEIALAMFFSDCYLPEKKGDVFLSINGGDKRIEIKGNSACITKRVSTDIPYQDIKGLSNRKLNYGLLRRILKSNVTKAKSNSSEPIDSVDEASKNIPAKPIARLGNSERIETLEDVIKVVSNPELLTTSKFWKANLSSLVKKMGDAKKIPNKEQLMFAILFGCLWEHYIPEFDTMLIWNTDDFVNYNMVAINPPSGNWYDNGLLILEKLSQLGLILELKPVHQELGFEVNFV